MFIIDALFRSFYFLTSKTDVGGEPNVFSAWMLMSGVQVINLMTLNYLVMYLGEAPLFRGKVSHLVIGAAVFVVNALYVFSQGERACEGGQDRSPVLAAWYAGSSFLAMIVVMVLLIFQAAD